MYSKISRNLICALFLGLSSAAANAAIVNIEADVCIGTMYRWFHTAGAFDDFTTTGCVPDGIGKLEWEFDTKDITSVSNHEPGHDTYSFSDAKTKVSTNIRGGTYFGNFGSDSITTSAHIEIANGVAGNPVTTAFDGDLFSISTVNQTANQRLTTYLFVVGEGNGWFSSSDIIESSVLSGGPGDESGVYFEMESWNPLTSSYEFAWRTDTFYDSKVQDFSIAVSQVSEPLTSGLFGFGLVGLAAIRYKRKNKGSITSI